jgi:hypothetical protein
MWEGYRTTIPLPTYWWPRRDHTPRTTVRTAEATATHDTVNNLRSGPTAQRTSSATLIPDLHRQLQGKRTQLTATAAPDITTATDRLLITDTSSPASAGFAPLCVNSQAHPTAQVAHSLWPLRGYRHYHPHIQMTAYSPQLGITLGTHAWRFVPERHGFALLCVSSPAHPQTQSPPTLARLTAQPSPTDRWLPHSLNLGLRRDHM